MRKEHANLNVKIGFRILTTIFTKTAMNKEETLPFAAGSLCDLMRLLKCSGK
jgi:hypothetical protein